MFKQTALAAATALLCLALPVSAKVSADEAAKLKTTLTPIGAERAGNAEGTIPAWEGGLTQAPPCYKGEGTRYCDPFTADQPEYTITKANMAQYADKLSEGQKAMLEKFPDSYKMPVYKTRRSAAYPQSVYDATAKNAVNAELGGGGEAMVNAIHGIPFPIPKSGVEPVWNHKVRYRGQSGQRWNSQAAVTTSGNYNLVKLREDISFPYAQDGMTPDKLNNVIIYFLQVVTEPPRLAGTITLVHETMDQVKEPRRAWQYNPGQRRIRRAPNVAYDNPGVGADGLRTNDQTDTFNGATDRYTWKIVGKQEAFIPYNAYKIHSDQYKIKDIVQRGHINQDLTRYELHRVWVVEGEVKPTTTHMYAKRRFYLDEDTWQIALVDIYDRRGALWRWQETHTIQAYDHPFNTPILETVYDLQNNRYLAQAMNNEDPENKEMPFAPSYFDPSNVQKQATK
ncbi:DUF1329 domain-containing protein [Sinimarinibacterium sp. NLF-5-8]|uniref:DUF1329 domain-containing protein n=1 Tax=Sinimarinibacterium sp. NLF-5-8 TaxID=2698684 RepID=UPI00137BCF44|nr:DUF1329 domain-containing protein [Sinimarinibacterium sp. NLF-5-8]QHS10866.1 DUF1329 domain-containing protein [Sinimarinibacterium sp. NLF-5-8]